MLIKLTMPLLSTGQLVTALGRVFPYLVSLNSGPAAPGFARTAKKPASFGGGIGPARRLFGQIVAARFQRHHQQTAGFQWT